MKVVLFAGGFGARLSEETEVKPKPMVEIGEKPLLWHIMKIYSHYGHRDFIILLGYKGYVIKEYFANYFLHQSNVTFDLAHNSMEVHSNSSEEWRVTLLDTGYETMTGGRLLRAKEFIGDETFLLTYGDGVANIDLDQLIRFHRSHGRAATMTAVQPEGRFGVLNLGADNRVAGFHEKPKGERGWINGGFFVCEPRVLDYIAAGDETVFEQEPLQNLAQAGELYTYRHTQFWMCMDTLRDKRALLELWKKGEARWRVWEE